VASEESEKEEKKMVGRADKHTSTWVPPHIQFSAFVSPFSHLIVPFFIFLFFTLSLSLPLVPSML